MIEAELAYAFTVGMIATVNPCGFAMLPAYLMYFLGLEGADESATASVPRALAVSGVVTAGFVLVFGTLGLAVTHLSVTVHRQIPWFTMLIGVALVALGVAMVLGFQLTIRLPKVRTGRIGSDLASMFVFGVSYAVASLSCTLPIFLPLMTRTFRNANLASGVTTFLVYALGMGTLLAALSVTMAGARTALLGRLRRALPYMNRVAGAVVAVAGVYLVYYGWWERGVYTDLTTAPSRGPVSFVFDWSASISDWFRSVGGLELGIVLGAVVLIAVILAVGLRRPSAGPPVREEHPAGR